jgi:pSer/pThr/pTyr-binding forkhead associated (FHA) protein
MQMMLKPMTNAKVYLKALTPEAEGSIGAKLFLIPRFPFRVGRESRRQQELNYPNSRRLLDSPPNNDLFIAETMKPFNVSREHFQIEWRADAFFIVDRGSACGTLVEGVAVGGGRKGGRHPLSSGDVIIVGTSESQYIYKFIINH